FGRETRPAYKMLQYATDPWIPRLSGNEEACIAFLLELGVDLKVENHWRSWSDLDRGEKQRVVSALVSHMLERGCGIKEVERLAGETYTLVREPAGSPTRDAKAGGPRTRPRGRHAGREPGRGRPRRRSPWGRRRDDSSGDRRKVSEVANRVVREQLGRTGSDSANRDGGAPERGRA